MELLWVVKENVWCFQTGSQDTSSAGSQGVRGPSVPRSHTDSPALGPWSDLTLTRGAHSALANQPSPALGLWSSVHTQSMDLMTQGEQRQSVSRKAPGKSTAPTPRTGEDEVVTWTQTFSQHSVYTTLSSWTAYLLVNENVRII